MELCFHLSHKNPPEHILSMNNFLEERNKHLVSLCFCQEQAVLGDFQYNI